MARMRGSGGSSGSGFGFGGKFFGERQGTGVKYNCLACGVEHSKDSCPRCGSKMKGAKFRSS